MKEIPMLFSGPMVRAILEGRKTQTRRIVKMPTIQSPEFGYTAFTPKGHVSVRGVHPSGEYGESFIKLPAHPGDRIWVRETFAEVGCIGWPIDRFEYAYRADFAHNGGNWEGYADMCFEKWKPSIHMPRKASRILLEVKSLYAEPLQDITRNDAIAEGVGTLSDDFTDGFDYFSDAVDAFRSLWNNINGNWDKNPCVWVYEFERVQ